MIGGLLLIGGTAAAGWGISTATRARRPHSLGGALVGALGVALALLGATRLLVPGFF